MKTKDKVLAILKENNNRYVSGEEMAEELFVTRAAIWKAIKSLQDMGHNIEAVTNKGYRLIMDIGMPSVLIIKDYLNAYGYIEVSDLIKDIDIVIYDEVDSTNDVARRYALDNPGKSAMIIASSQTNGRGRRGRKFYSPKGSGIYISLLIYPKVSIERATRLTSMMAVALSRAIADATEVEPKIKWVNDIYVNDLKVAGILTETYSSVEDENLSYVIIGVGVNLYVPAGGFPSEIKNIAGSVLNSVKDIDTPNRLCAALLYRFNQVIIEPAINYLNEYRNRSMLIGNFVKVMQYSEGDEHSGNEYAYVTGIDEECHLCVRYDDGREKALSTGEVSVIKY